MNVDESEVLHANPRFLPGGTTVTFANCIGNWNTYQLEAVSIQSGDRTVLADDAYAGYVTTSGHLVFGRNGTIFAAPFDSRRVEVTGSEAPVVSPVQMEFLGRNASVAVSPDGTLVYTPGGQGILQRRIAWISRGGDVDELPVPHDRYRQIELSPEAGEFAVSIMDGHSSSVHTYEFRQEVFTRQTSARHVPSASNNRPSSDRCWKTSSTKNGLPSVSAKTAVTS